MRLLGLSAAIPLSFLSITSYLSPDSTSFVAHGPMTPGHENVGCVHCHEKAPGTFRQQVQANVDYLFGWRSTAAEFGYLPANSKQCLSCHERPNERHPIYRFQEPRFETAIKTVDAQSCLGCHSEHEKRRVSVGGEFCSACHEGLKLKNDPVDVPHTLLIADKQWQTCLGCHDFHGNHKHQPPDKLQEAYSVQEILSYLQAGPDPFAPVKIHKAKEK